MKTTTDKMAVFISDTRFNDLTTDVVHQSKLMVLDFIACAIGGSNHDRGLISRHVVEGFGGNKEATIIGGKVKTACLNAAYANANMASALDNDETFMNWCHISSNTVSSSLALAERGNASGNDLITAVAVGYEVACRIGLSTGYPGRVVGDKMVRHIVGNAPWISMGSIASAANLLRLNQQQVVYALGLQANFAPMPTLQYFAQSEILPHVKYWDSGWMAMGGVMSALLAREGFTTYPKGIFDGDLGFWKVYGAESCDLDIMTERLGEKWWFLEASFKIWPCCRIFHHSLTAFSRLIDKYEIKPEEVEKVTIKGFMFLPHFFLKDPKGPVGSQFSAPHAMAMLIFRIPPGPQWHTPEILEDSKVKEFRNRVDIEMEPKMEEYINSQLSQKPKIIKRIPTTVEIAARGQTFRETVNYAKGDPWEDEFRLNDEDLKNKFRINASSYKPISYKWRQMIEEIIDTCFNLEKVSNVNDLTKLVIGD